MSLGVWKEDPVSLEALVDHLQLNDSHVHTDRPYVWCSIVQSMDGLIGWNEPDIDTKSDSKLIALHNKTDWKLLNASWMLADAIVTSGKILRLHPVAGLFCGQTSYPEMHDYRKLHNKPEVPIRIIVSGSGDINLVENPYLALPNAPFYIVTTQQGAETLKSKFTTSEKYPTLDSVFIFFIYIFLPIN